MELNYMDINSVGDNLVGFLSQIGWTKKENSDYPLKTISMKKTFVLIDTNGGNIALISLLHNKCPHRIVVLDKIYAYLNE